MDDADAACLIGSRPATSRICHHLTTQKDCTTRIWWIKVFKLRQGQSCTSILDRRAEDREEGAQGDPAEEALATLEPRKLHDTPMNSAVHNDPLLSPGIQRVLPGQ